MVQTMMQATVDGGLCSTCNNRPGCFHHARRGPALFCELFDDFIPPRLSEVETAMSRGAGAPRARCADLKGLCMNCDHRQSCAYPKPPEGIWHCEEYV